MEQQEPRTIEAARITCKIIELLQEYGEAGVTELSAELGRSKSSVHAYLTTLVDEKYVTNHDGSYSLSLRYLSISEHVKNRIGKFDIITDEIDNLANTTDEVAQFATCEYGQLVYLYKAWGELGIESKSSIGDYEYLHSTSLGKAILSRKNKKEIRNIANEHGLPGKTVHTITDVESLLEEVEEAKEQGYAIDSQENILGLKCVAAPVVLDDETVLGAVSVSGPSSRMTDDRIQGEIKNAVLKAANVIQLNTRFS